MFRFSSRGMPVSAALSALFVSICAGASEADPPGFAQVLPDEVHWSASKAIPPGGETAVIYGDAGKPHLYISRVRQPAGYKVAPHSHPEDRVYTVISGTFYIGFGDHFDPTRLKAFPAGSVFVVPAKESHFHWMRSGESVVQITGVGPSGIEYVEASDDPRRR